MSRRLPKYLTESELTRLLAVPDAGDISQHRDLCMMRVMAGSGLRVSECCNLARDHVDFDAGLIRIRCGKGAKDREAVLDTTAGTDTLIRAYLQRRPAGEYLFQTSSRKRVLPRHVRRVVKRYAHSAGVSEPGRVSPHSLRHTFAVLYLEENPDDLRGLQILLGHESIETTQVYAHILDSRLRERVTAIHARLPAA